MHTDQWPPADYTVTPFYLHSQGHANTLNGDGALSVDAPANEPADEFVYDPAQPFPSGWKDAAGHDMMADQRPIENRGDVLVYTTDALKEDMEIAGCVHTRLFASSTAPDTDFTCRLLDVLPDGAAKVLLGGMVRAKFRNGPPASLIEPGKVYEYDIELGNISNLFAAGHRVRVEISSSLYPKYDRNLNTGEPLGTGRTYQTAVQSVMHSQTLPSAVLLPVRAKS